MPRLRLLLLEDAPDDAELALAALAEAGYACETECADSGTAFERAFLAGRFDIVIADYHLHGYTGLDALAVVRRADALLPFILLSGALGEERAVDALRAGATDFVLKDNLVRLAGVVSRALDEVRLRRQHLATQQALELSERRYRAIVEDQSELIIRMQPDSTVNFVNGAYCRYFGYQPDQVRGRPVLESMSPENREALQRNLAGISPQAPAYERDSLVRDASGAERWMHWSGRGIFDGRGMLAEVQAVGRDVTELRRAMDELGAARERLQGLSRRLLEVQESERKSLARELHDDIGQSLTALKLNLEALQRGRNGATLAARVREALETTQHTLERVRQISLSLRPLQLDDLGLAAALRSHLDRQATLGGFTPHPEIQDFPARLPPEVETACFRVAQEAVNNIVRHARARNVWLQLAVEGEQLVLGVRDDGAGFDVEAAQRRAALGASLGVVSMAERAALAGGTLRIDSAPGQGTAVLAAFALAKEA
ncbi:MAG TPA: PAS domain S-box protein [Burkholderiales bacterium]|nr:PAS domain S-box protein [Burkholderiales bacterium]